jgi:hypothetical protein
VAVTACLLLALVLSSVAAGASQTATPKKWVTVFCGSVVTWEKSVKSSATALSKTVKGLDAKSKADLRAARNRLVQFLAGLVTVTNVMIHKVRAVGPPAVKNGSKIQSGVLAGFAQVSKAFADGKKTAQALPTNNANTFAKQAVGLGITIQATANRISTSFRALSKYSTKPLDDAAKKAPACSKLG